MTRYWKLIGLYYTMQWEKVCMLNSPEFIPSIQKGGWLTRHIFISTKLMVFEQSIFVLEFTVMPTIHHSKF